jgi:histidine kinase
LNTRDWVSLFISQKMTLKNITHTVGFRLFIFIFGILIIGFGFSAYHTISTHTSHLMDNVYSSAEIASDIIKRSTRYGMLINRKEDVQHIITTIGNEPGVEGIRIFNKKGEIIFSTQESELYTRAGLQDETCNICHTGAKPLVTIPTENLCRIYRSETGHRVLAVTNVMTTSFSAMRVKSVRQLSLCA